MGGGISLRMDLDNVWHIGIRGEETVRRLLIIGVAALALAIPTGALANNNNGVIAAQDAVSAANCNAWHGAPGGLGAQSPYYFVKDYIPFGSYQGVQTGDNNSDFAAACNATP